MNSNILKILSGCFSDEKFTLSLTEFIIKIIFCIYKNTVRELATHQFIICIFMILPSRRNVRDMTYCPHHIYKLNVYFYTYTIKEILFYIKNVYNSCKVIVKRQNFSILLTSKCNIIVRYL